MQKMVNDMALALYNYTDYYDTVAWGYVVEAVENTKTETGLSLDVKNVEAYHQYISENFI